MGKYISIVSLNGSQSDKKGKTIENTVCQLIEKYDSYENVLERSGTKQFLEQKIFKEYDSIGSYFRFFWQFFAPVSYLYSFWIEFLVGFFGMLS